MTNVQRMHELMRKHTKAELLKMAFAGGLVDYNSPAQWRKDEIAATVVDQEERRAQAAQERQTLTPAGRQRVDITQPYGVKVQRADEVKEWTFSTQYQTAPEDGGPLTPIGVAQRAAFECRLMHGFYGPLKVSLWAHRGDLEHYRLDPPNDAMVFDFAAQPELQPERPTLRVAD